MLRLSLSMTIRMIMKIPGEIIFGDFFCQSSIHFVTQPDKKSGRNFHELNYTFQQELLLRQMQ